MVITDCEPGDTFCYAEGSINNSRRITVLFKRKEKDSIVLVYFDERGRMFVHEYSNELRLLPGRIV